MTEWFCDTCGEAHQSKCPKLSAKRREQVREAQRRYREKTKDADNQAATIADLKRQLKASKELVVALQRKVRILEAEVKSGSDVHRVILGTEKRSVKVAYRSVCKIVHPDRHNGDPEAQRLMALVNAAKDKLSS